MATDASAAAEFYATPLGAVAAHVLRLRLMALWPRLDGRSVLGIGYPAPYLRLWREHAARTIALTPAQIGAARWPPGAPGLSCTAEETALPFPDLSFDHVLLVHGLEAAENARALLREAWRVLKDDGRLLVVAPNRAGLWALSESTPFGHGHPYSPRQLARLLGDALFRVERRDTALHFPPSRRRLLLRTAGLWDSAGRAMAPGIAGVTLTEAVKDLYGTIPANARPIRRLVFAEAR